jgi:NMD protein affecting ribosome stability and mRNA decay
VFGRTCYSCGRAFVAVAQADRVCDKCLRELVDLELSAVIE